MHYNNSENYEVQIKIIFCQLIFLLCQTKFLGCLGFDKK